ncbi:MAG: recombinase family protein [Acidobacteriaceae bacterium]
MKRVQRFDPSSPFDFEEMKRALADQWRPVSIIWEKPDLSPPAESAPLPLPPSASATAGPYGLQIAENCRQLEVNPNEAEVLFLMMEMTAADQRDPAIAQELNRRGFRTRDGWPWTPVSVFQVLPRLIEAAPQILNSEQWRRRTHIPTPIPSPSKPS